MNWLKNYWDLEEELSVIEWDIKKSKLELTRWEEGGDLFDNNKFDTALMHQKRIRYSINQLQEVLLEKQKLKEELVSFMDNFKGLDNQILKMKYIDGMTLEVIAEELSYSVSHIKKKHAELVKRVDFLKNMGFGVDVK